MTDASKRERSLKAPLNLYVTDETRRQLSVLADMDGRSISSLIERFAQQATADLAKVAHLLGPREEG